MLFNDVIGHDIIKKWLIKTVKDNRISHAQLFTGPEGSGSLALAIAFAQYISCQEQKESDSCGTCVSCQKYVKLIHPDLHFVFPVATTKSITKNPVSDDFISDWRSFILDNPYQRSAQWYDYIGVGNKQGIITKNESYEILRKLSLKAFESEFKVVIVWLPEKMNQTAANKLLKIIEEPPPKTLFLLVSEEPGKILPTILSRTAITKIPPIDDSSLFKSLKEQFPLSNAELKQIVQLVDGNYIQAIELLSEDENNADNFQMFTQLMRLCYTKKVIEIISWVDEISIKGREKQKSLLSYALRMIRENFILNVIKEQNKKMIRLYGKEAEFSQKFYPFINENNVYAIAEEFNNAHFHIASNANSKIVLLDMALKIIKLIKT
jgi:DNA polymerase-3 subunit delta'